MNSVRLVQLRSIDHVSKRYYDRGLRVIAMDGMESDDTVRAYRKKYDIPYPIAMDEDGGFTNALQKSKKPGTVFYPAQAA